MHSSFQLNMLHTQSDNEISIAWSNVAYETKGWFGGGKVILRRVTGHCRYGTVNGLLGPSGAGKTTLLNCLNGKLQSGLSCQSSIYLNHNEPKQALIRFIQQHVHETMFPVLTVRQTLAYAYRFKNKHANYKHFEEHLQQVLPQLLLDPDILEQRLQVCSGGQLKRIAIAQELMSVDKPSFLFVDEPTTGLDSHSAYIVIKCLKSIAQQHQITVLVSLHTPNSDIINMLDKVYILAKGGVCIYSGPPGYLRENLKERIAVEFDEQKPPIEEYLRIACNGIGDDGVRQLAQWTLENEHKQLLHNIGALKFMENGIKVYHKSFSVCDFLIQFHRMFNLLFIRGFKEFLLTFVCYSLVFIFCQTFFDGEMLQANTCRPLSVANSSSDEPCGQSFQDHKDSTIYIVFQCAVLFFLGVPITFLSATLFGPLLQVFRNEHGNAWYSMSVFYWSSTLVHLIYLTIFAAQITVLTYFVHDHRIVDSGQFNWIRFSSFALFFWIFSLYMQSFGQFFSFVFMDYAQVPIIAAIAFYMTMQGFDGYYFPLKFITDPLIRIQSKILSVEVISRGLLYSFYGIDRCDPDKGISFTLDRFEIDADNVYWELWRIALNIAVLRVSAILFLAVKFSWSFANKTFKECTHLAHIDFGEFATHNTTQIDIVQPIKSSEQEDFERFSSGKFLIGWRSLTLFASNSVYEMRSAHNVNHSSKLILRDLNGQFRFGTINALMGTSGAGKTSLLKVLNGRMKTRLSSESKFYLSKYTPITTCYITQQVSGHLMPGLTARQSLVYASRLKNVGVDCGQIDHIKIADNILTELAMADAGDTLVTRCSGGEQKRLALGLELTSLRMPNLICIDEPTSGLDSNTAQLVIGCLFALAKRHNLTIVTTIHQPNTDVLNMFDEVYIMASGGVCIYSGPPTKIHQHLAQVDIGQTGQENRFPVEQLVKYSCLKHSDEAVETLVEKTTPQILQHDEQLMRDTQLVLDGIQPNRTRFSFKPILPLFSRYLHYLIGHGWISLSFFSILVVFLTFTLSRFSSKILISGCHSIDEDFINCTSIKEDEMSELVLNYHYQIFVYNVFNLLFQMECSISMFSQLPLFKIQHRNGWYSTGVFYLVVSIIEFLPRIPLTMIYVYVVDNTHQVRPDIYYYMVMAVLLTSLATQAFGHICALLSNGRLTILIYMLPSLFTVFFITSGALTPIPDLHYAYQLIAYFNLYRYQNEIVLLLQYGFGRCRYREIQLTLYLLGISDDHYFYTCIYRIITLALLYRCLAIIIIYFKFNPFRNYRERAQRIRDHHKSLTRTNTIIPGLSCHQEFTIKQIQI